MQVESRDAHEGKKVTGTWMSHVNVYIELGKRYFKFLSDRMKVIVKKLI